MNTYRCPTDREVIFTAEPDFEGLIDCPHCGIWFKSAQGPVSATGGLFRGVGAGSVP